MKIECSKKFFCTFSFIFDRNLFIEIKNKLENFNNCRLFSDNQCKRSKLVAGQAYWSKWSDRFDSIARAWRATKGICTAWSRFCAYNQYLWNKGICRFITVYTCSDKKIELVPKKCDSIRDVTSLVIVN